MRHQQLIRGGLGVIGMCLPGLALAAAQPSAGYYTTSGYQVSATPSSVCAAAGEAAGASYSGIFYYPGPGKAGTTFRIVTNDSKGEGVFLELFPTTPAAGVTSFTGKITEGPEGGSTLSLPFKATFTFLDSSSFEAKLVTTIPLSATEVCTITDNLVFVKVSP